MMLADVGQPVPDIEHAVSVSLPSWRSVVGYEEGEDWVLSKMKTGYPRFFTHLTIQELEREILTLHGKSNEKVMLFPSRKTALRCQQFFHDKAPGIPTSQTRLVQLETVFPKSARQSSILSGLHCCFYPSEEYKIAKQVWQHTGDGISSRRGEFCLKALKEGFLQQVTSSTPANTSDMFCKGPKRYQRGASQSNIAVELTSPLESVLNGSDALKNQDPDNFIEERFGRNLNATLAFKAKLAIKRRISGCLEDNSDLDQALAKSPQNCDSRQRGLSDNDVYLFPTGMSSIFNAHQVLMARARKEGGEVRKSICFGFPYIDTLKVLEKWGPGCLFYGNGLEEDLDDLEHRLETGERFLGLFTEFPSNPLLRSPNLSRIRKMADKYEFAVVVDETVGNIININVLPHADIVVSSLTKVFSGDSNVMGGSCVLNPQGPMYDSLKEMYAVEYEDNYWAEDGVFMERNSRDFIIRIERINVNATAIASTLKANPMVRTVYYPQLNESKPNYDACRSPNGGYGGLLSVIFNKVEQAVAFFDALEVQKGPSLGSNFTLACPYTVLAHYGEMDWTSQYGVEPDLVRVSVGLEETTEIIRIFEVALDAASSV